VARIISGKVMTSAGVGISGVTVSCTGKSNVTTTSTGLFSFDVASSSWTGTIRASKSGIQFNPLDYTYGAGESGAANQNFVQWDGTEDFGSFGGNTGSWWTSAQSNGWIKMRHQKRYAYLWVGYTSGTTSNWYYRFRTIIVDEWEHQGLTKSAAQSIAATYSSVPVDPLQSATGTYQYATAIRVQADQWKVVRRQEVVSAWSNTGPVYLGGKYWLLYGSQDTGQY